MKLSDVRLVKFKHDVGDLLAWTMRVQRECDEICRKAQELMEEFYEMIDNNEDEE
jgi:hypothetical protein